METKEIKNGSTAGVVSLICGILALLLAFVPCVGVSAIPLEAVAIVFGVLSVVRAIEFKSSMGMAVAGMITAIVALILSIAWIVVIGRGINKNLKDSDFFRDITNSMNWNMTYELDDASFESTDSTMVRLSAILDSMNNAENVHFDMNLSDSVVQMSITDGNGKKVNMNIDARKKK